MYRLSDALMKLFPAMAACFVLSLFTHAQTNFNQIALLKWYGLMNGSSLSMGGNPSALAFDGLSIWVVNGGGVARIRASDGWGMIILYWGAPIQQLAFDGANIWATEGSYNTVGKIRASDST